MTADIENKVGMAKIRQEENEQKGEKIAKFVRTFLLATFTNFCSTNVAIGCNPVAIEAFVSSE
jgi:hypothetical protein